MSCCPALATNIANVKPAITDPMACVDIKKPYLSMESEPKVIAAFSLRNPNSSNKAAPIEPIIPICREVPKANIAGNIIDFFRKTLGTGDRISFSVL